MKGLVHGGIWMYKQLRSEDPVKRLGLVTGLNWQAIKNDNETPQDLLVV